MCSTAPTAQLCMNMATESRPGATASRCGQHKARPRTVNVTSGTGSLEEGSSLGGHDDDDDGPDGNDHVLLWWSWDSCKRHMAFDDLEWISDTVFHLGDRVWAQGREAAPPCLPNAETLYMEADCLVEDLCLCIAASTSRASSSTCRSTADSCQTAGLKVSGYYFCGFLIVIIV